MRHSNQLWGVDRRFQRVCQRNPATTDGMTRRGVVARVNVKTVTIRIGTPIQMSSKGMITRKLNFAAVGR